MQILLVEDDPQQRGLISNILTAENHQVIQADSVEAAIVSLKNSPPDIVFCDWKLGSLSGIDLLTYVRKNQPALGFAIATAYGSISHAVEAMQAGADDYLAKPFQRQALLLCIDKIYQAKQLRSQNASLSQALAEQQHLVDIIGSADCMQQLYQRIQRISDTSATVLITGESGTGKELAARSLHQLSERKYQSFVALNCGAIPESLAEAELFGAMKGAYTGAHENKTGKLQAADNGTLFLDEIGELPLVLQAKLLRFLQESSITPVGSSKEIHLNVRVIAATHRHLPTMVNEGHFREDLFYRLNIVPIHMPALRDRGSDIGKLIDFFLQKFAAQYQINKPQISKASLKVLLDYHWPGNVRELSNAIERFVLLGDESELLAQLRSPPTTKPHQFTLPEQGLDWEAFEKDCLAQALERHNGNRTQAAKCLNMNYKAFLYRLEKYGLG